ncbi:DnaJ domain-containing protein [Ancylobacter sp. 6x-1]|uniref:DnaJ domain-containing protein n=1 Tax=Ancylobacter crimeensis TaxID=2579147 RepID=A0ABT0DC90_9HYPH|nr:DnaJ domain-containing protein [Ancylobacter crimeensis]MCK0197578.1 DnaJ domain-containing protein [Ancylobacter crimeensis]
MISLLAGALVLLGGVYLLKLISRSNPERLARLLRRIGGWLLLAVAALLIFRGHIEVAIPLGVFALSLIGWRAIKGPGALGGTRSAQDRRFSRMQTSLLDMKLDRVNARIEGRVLAGPFAGRALDSLARPELLQLYRDADVESRRLLEAYLDRRAPGWREDTQRDAGRRSADRPERGGSMTEEEAYQILGLQPAADVASITRAHRSLMKKLHPDQGGSNYLAARVNEAKDILMRRHR